jgi:hypothetical protein
MRKFELLTNAELYDLAVGLRLIFDDYGPSDFLEARLGSVVSAINDELDLRVSAGQIDMDAEHERSSQPV